MQGWGRRGLWLELGVSLTWAPFVAVKDSTGWSSREAGWPRSGGAAWTITRCSWGPTMPQPWATVTAVCRLSPGGMGQGQGPAAFGGPSEP